MGNKHLQYLLFTIVITKLRYFDVINVSRFINAQENKIAR